MKSGNSSKGAMLLCCIAIEGLAVGSSDAFGVGFAIESVVVV